MKIWYVEFLPSAYLNIKIEEDEKGGLVQIDIQSSTSQWLPIYLGLLQARSETDRYISSTETAMHSLSTLLISYDNSLIPKVSFKLIDWNLFLLDFQKNIGVSHF